MTRLGAGIWETASRRSHHRCKNVIFPMAGALIISIEQPREKYHCSACGSDHVHAKGTVPRLFRAVPIVKEKDTHYVVVHPVRL